MASAATQQTTSNQMDVTNYSAYHQYQTRASPQQPAGVHESSSGNNNNLSAAVCQQQQQQQQRNELLQHNHLYYSHNNQQQENNHFNNQQQLDQQQQHVQHQNQHYQQQYLQSGLSGYNAAYAVASHYELTAAAANQASVVDHPAFNQYPYASLSCSLNARSAGGQQQSYATALTSTSSNYNEPRQTNYRQSNQLTSLSSQPAAVANQGRLAADNSAERDRGEKIVATSEKQLLARNANEESNSIDHHQQQYHSSVLTELGTKPNNNNNNSNLSPDSGAQVNERETIIELSSFSGKKRKKFGKISEFSIRDNDYHYQSPSIEPLSSNYNTGGLEQVNYFENLQTNNSINKEGNNEQQNSIDQSSSLASAYLAAGRETISSLTAADSDSNEYKVHRNYVGDRSQHYPTSRYNSCPPEEDNNQNEEPENNSNSNSNNNNNNNNNNINRSSEEQRNDGYNGTSGEQTGEYNQLRVLEMRKEKSRDAARSRRSKENHEFYELAKLLPLPAAITSQLDFLDKASIIRLTISFLKLRQFSVNGHPPWAPDFTTLGSINPYSSQPPLAAYSQPGDSNHYSGEQPDDHQSRPASVVQSSRQTPKSYTNEPPVSHNERRLTTPLTPSSGAFSTLDPYLASCHQEAVGLQTEKNLPCKNASLFEIHQGTHILQSLDGFAFAIGRDGRFLYISETVSMYLGLSQVEMTGSSVFDYTHQQDHEELARQLGIPFSNQDRQEEAIGQATANNCDSPAPASVHSQYSVASNETLIDDHLNVNNTCSQRKRSKTVQASSSRGAYCRQGRKSVAKSAKNEATCDLTESNLNKKIDANLSKGTNEDPLVRQFSIRMKSTLTKRGCQHFKSSGYRVVHVVAHLRSYQSNDHGHLMDPFDESGNSSSCGTIKPHKRRGPKNQQTQLELKAEQTGDNSKSTGDYVQKQKIIGLVAVAIALPPPSINELKLESDTFVLRLGLDLRVTHIEPKITELLHYPVELIAGRSLYSLVHPADVGQVQKCHRDLLRKGQMMSGYYRLLARSGGYIWIQTCATLICNNTLGNNSQAAPILPASPMPNTSSSNHHQLTNVTGEHKLLHQTATTSYLNPSSSTSLDTTTTINHYGTISGRGNKLTSPALSSHISSNYESLDQDQCVIFVNYMITNIIDNEEILDICQSSHFTPLNSSFSGLTTNNSNNQQATTFNSPSSSCSSPCLGPLTKATPLHSTNTTNHQQQCRNYGSPSTATSTTSSGNNNNLTVSQRRQQSEMNSSSNKTTSREIKLALRRSSANNNNNNNKLAKSQLYLNTTNGNNQQESGCNFSMSNNNQDQLNKGICGYNNKTGNELVNANSSAYSYIQTANSVNLALAGEAAAVADASSWLNHQQQVVVGGGNNHLSHHHHNNNNNSNNNHTDHYSSVNRSIYKAAFGWPPGGSSASEVASGELVVGGGGSRNNSYGHHQPAQGAQISYAQGGGASAVGAAAAAAAYSTATGGATVAPGGVTGWDSAAVAAVAAASNLTGAHHNLNPYAHLESHHHHQTAAAVMGSSGGHHHHHHSAAAAGNYYNYYGYYGNKFI